MLIEHEVIVVGAGATGLMLAAELALAGVDVGIIERRMDQEIEGIRARGLHARTIEIFDQRGIAERFLAAGKTAQIAGFAGVTLDISDFPTRHPYGLALFQKHIERILAEWVGELGVPLHRGMVVTSLHQGDEGVTLGGDGGDVALARYVVGCDGGRSVVRKAAGIAFPGTEATTSNLLAEAELAEEPPAWGIHRTASGIHALSRLDDGAVVGILVTEERVASGGEPSLDELRAAMMAAYGSDFGVHSPRWISRFTDATRQAETYRRGRVLVAGDAAHVHPPDGGHGLQLGVQDAVNLGWKLGLVAKGQAPEALLDSYHAERHPVAARMLRQILAAVTLRREDDHTAALRATVAELLGVAAAARQMAGVLSGLELRYDPGGEHPLVGRRMPDLDVRTADGPMRVFSLLVRARPLLMDFGGAGDLDLSGWSDRVELVACCYEGVWDLPVIGPVPAPGAVLVRPDGYVAWVGRGSAAGLRAALARWFGPAAGGEAA